MQPDAPSFPVKASCPDQTQGCRTLVLSFNKRAGCERVTTSFHSAHDNLLVSFKGNCIWVLNLSPKAAKGGPDGRRVFIRQISNFVCLPAESSLLIQPRALHCVQGTCGSTKSVKYLCIFQSAVQTSQLQYIAPKTLAARQ
jgi:hypothetical protein